MRKSYQLPKQKQSRNHLNYSASRGLTFLNLNRRTGRKRRFLMASFITLSLSAASAHSVLIVLSKQLSRLSLLKALSINSRLVLNIRGSP